MRANKLGWFAGGCPRSNLSDWLISEVPIPLHPPLLIIVSGEERQRPGRWPLGLEPEHITRRAA